MREGWYWEREEKKECRLCGGKIESWVHVWKKCRNWGAGGKSRGKWFSRYWRRQRREEWMKEVERERRKRSKWGGRESSGEEGGNRAEEREGERIRMSE